MLTKRAESRSAARTATNQLWYGENSSLMEVELAKWVNLFRAKYPQASVRRFGYSETNEAELVAALHQAINTHSLFAQKTFLVLAGVLGTEAKSELGELIIKACSKESADTILVLVEAGRVAWNKPLPRALKKLAEQGGLKIREFVFLSVVELERWLVAKVRAQGGSIASAAARLLAQDLDNDFIALENEIAKLIAYRQGGEIRAVDVNSLVMPRLKEDVFAFVEAVGRRDIAAAQEAMLRQFRQGVSPQSLIGLLAWQVRVLALVRQALDSSHKKTGVKELATKLGLHPYVVSKALQQIPYYSAERIGWLYNELTQMDMKLKSSSVDPQVLFGLFLSKLSAHRITVSL